MKNIDPKKFRRTILLTLANARVTQKHGIPRKIYNLFLKRTQLARIKMKIGNSKLNKYIPVKAPSFVIKGVG